MSRPDVRLSREVDGAWHREINEYGVPHSHREGARGGLVAPGSYDPAKDGKTFLYEAKKAAEEVPRLALLFGIERRRELPQVHHQCSHDRHGTPVHDNHLTCCLGVECRKCPHLAVIDRVQTHSVYEGKVDDTGKRVVERREEPITDEQRDVMKAWTCATHILMRGGDRANEGYVLTTDDRMFWSNLHDSLAGGGL